MDTKKTSIISTDTPIQFDKGDNIVTEQLEDHLKDQMEFHEKRQQEQKDNTNTNPVKSTKDADSTYEAARDLLR